MLSHLLLMRHAKSSWVDPALGDHARPLNARGRRAATAVGSALTAKGVAPDTIWASDAKRTRETAMHLIRAIPGAQTVHYLPEFYHGTVEGVLEVLQREAEPEGRLMLLGHNPGWAELHTHFTDQMTEYPTGACAVLERRGTDSWWLPESWKAVDFIRPRDLDI